MRAAEERSARFLPVCSAGVCAIAGLSHRPGRRERHLHIAGVSEACLSCNRRPRGRADHYRRGPYKTNRKSCVGILWRVHVGRPGPIGSCFCLWYELWTLGPFTACSGLGLRLTEESTHCGRHGHRVSRQSGCVPPLTQCTGPVASFGAAGPGRVGTPDPGSRWRPGRPAATLRSGSASRLRAQTAAPAGPDSDLRRWGATPPRT